MYVAKTDRTEETTVQMEPMGTPSKLLYTMFHKKIAEHKYLTLNLHQGPEANNNKYIVVSSNNI